MKSKLLALAALTVALSACDGSSPKGIVGVAYEALQRGNYPLFVSTFTPAAQAVYATPERFQQYQQMLTTYSADSFRIGHQKTIERRDNYERQSIVVLAHSMLTDVDDEHAFQGASHPDVAVGNPPQIFPGANAHIYPEVIPTGPVYEMTEALVFETECATYPGHRRACAIAAVRGAGL